MADDELKKLKRGELLDRMIELTRENEQLKAELSDMRAKLAERQLDLIDAGSIAEASMKLNGVFAAAQAAADQYLDNIERLYRGRGELVREAQSKAQALVAQAKLDARDEMAQVRIEAEAEAEQLKSAARVAADESRAQARKAQDEANEAKRAVVRAREEAERIVREARDQAVAIVEQAQKDAVEAAEAIEVEARMKAKRRMDEAERVSRNFEMATKVKCDNTMRRAMGEAHTYGETMRMAMHALGITPEMVPALEKATKGAAADAEEAPEEVATQAPVDPEETDAIAVDAPVDDDSPDQDETYDVIADLDRAVSSARAAVAAALSNAKTAPGTLDDESVAAMYPNSAEQL